jgi:hypothetical protein
MLHCFLVIIISIHSSYFPYYCARSFSCSFRSFPSVNIGINEKIAEEVEGEGEGVKGWLWGWGRHFLLSHSINEGRLSVLLLTRTMRFSSSFEFSRQRILQLSPTLFLMSFPAAPEAPSPQPRI